MGWNLMDVVWLICTQVLGVHGQDRATHQLSEFIPLHLLDTLFTGDLSLERVPLSHYL